MKKVIVMNLNRHLLPSSEQRLQSKRLNVNSIAETTEKPS